MTSNNNYPPFIKPGDRVVLFDGVCKLCGAWARFLIRYDRHRVFRLASVQSAEGQAILQWFGLPVDHYETMVLVEGSRAYFKSAAFIRVVARLPFPWFVAAAMWLLPAPIRNWLYDRVALNRYAIFGKHDACVLPGPDHAARFLS